MTINNDITLCTFPSLVFLKPYRIAATREDGVEGALYIR